MLCISIQLILIALFYFYKRQLRLVILGTLCFFVGVTFINNLYWNFIKESLPLSILFGAGKDLFFAPLIYLYVSTAQISKEKIRSHVLTHLAIPFVIHIVYITIKFGFRSFYAENYYWTALSLGYSVLFIKLFYLVLVVVAFKKIITKPFLPKVKRKYLYFMYILLGYFWFSSFYGMLPYLTKSLFFAENFLVMNRYVFMPLAMLVNTYLLLFSITEFFKFKSYFAPSRLYQKEAVNILDIEEIGVKLKEDLVNKKLYTQPNLTVANLADELQIDTVNLRHYFKEQQTSFRKYLNTVRVSEFKSLLLNKEFKNYNLTGLSTLVGFQSEATFFRVFKEIEGVTPSEFLQKNKTD